MSFDSDFLELMPYKVKLTAPTGKNAQGLPTYAGGTAKTYRARIVGPLQSQRKQQSQENTPLFSVWVACGTDVITADYKLELPADPVWGSDAPLIFSVNRVTDEEGHHHAKLTIGFMYHRQGQT